VQETYNVQKVGEDGFTKSFDLNVNTSLVSERGLGLKMQTAETLGPLSLIDNILAKAATLLP
jgi:hypothetical protein